MVELSCRLRRVVGSSALDRSTLTQVSLITYACTLVHNGRLSLLVMHMVDFGATFCSMFS
jgi:hypothetical protein